MRRCDCRAPANTGVRISEVLVYITLQQRGEVFMLRIGTPEKCGRRIEEKRDSIYCVQIGRKADKMSISCTSFLDRSSFRVILRCKLKCAVRFLEGSGDQELVQHEGTWYARQHGEFEAIWLTTC